MNRFHFMVVLGLIAFLAIAVSFKGTEKVEVSQTEIMKFSNSFAPSQKPLQTDCCYPDDKDTQTVAHGAWCVVGSQYCAPNGCPSGTTECQIDL